MNDELVERLKSALAHAMRENYFFSATAIVDAIAELEALTAQLAEARESERAAMTELNGLKDALAQTAEFICRKCGRRQDGPTDNEARF